MVFTVFYHGMFCMRHVPRKRRTALISPCGPSNVLPVPSFQQDSRNPSLGHSQLGGERQPSTSNEDNDLPAAWLFRLVPKKHRTPLISPRGPSNVLPTPPFQRDSLGGRQPWATNRVDHPVGADFRACTSHPKTSRSLGSDGVQLSGDKTIVKLAFSTENYQHGILEVQGYDAEQSYYTFYPKLTDSGEKRGPFKLKASIRRSQGTPGRHQATSASEASSLGPGE